MRDETSSFNAREYLLAFCPPSSSWLLTRSSMHKFHACISPTNAVFSVLFELRGDDILGRKKKKEGYLFPFFFLLGFVFFFLNDSKRFCCSIATFLYSTGFPALFGIFLRKHFGFMKWDTEAFRTMGLVHIYIRTYVDAKHLGLAELQPWPPP